MGTGPFKVISGLAAVIITLLLVGGFALWFLSRPVERCYFTGDGGYMVAKVLDSAGKEHSPRPLSLKGTGETGCGIDRDAKPFKVGKDGERYQFKATEEGIVPVRSSLTGRDLGVPNFVEVGLDDGGDWDDMRLWPLKGARWGHAHDLFE